MEHYVTLFDRLFLPQGLALHMSMERVLTDYTLWVLCIDDEVDDLLSKLKLPNVRLLKLSELETDEMKRVKQERARNEYCWTITPFAPRFVFEADADAGRVTYIDADIWFRKKPNLIFSEFEASGKDVLITDHAYAPEYDQSATSGQYCVQFVTFTRNGGELVRKWWEERCIEWCFARVEQGKFGDQMYLDDWPERFPDQVHVLQDKELAMAPWNATRFPYGQSVFWHFQSLRLLNGSGNAPFAEWGPYIIPKPAKRNVYAPYLLDLRKAIDIMDRLGMVARAQARRSLVGTIKVLLHEFDGWLRRVSRS